MKLQQQMNREHRKQKNNCVLEQLLVGLVMGEQPPEKVGPSQSEVVIGGGSRWKTLEPTWKSRGYYKSVICTRHRGSLAGIDI